MADNKKYYYLKLKDSYFDKDNIRIIESMQNGHTFSLIILKLYLKSCKYDGRLMMTDKIPYNPDKVDILSKVINHDVSHVREAIQLACDLDLITIIDSEEIWMNDIQAFIGHSSTEADRKRTYRKKLEDKCPDNVLKKSDKYPPEIEKELKLKKEIKKFVKPTIEEIKQYCDERKNSIDPELFYYHYEANGWMRGKTKVKSWKGCIHYWERNNKENNKEEEIDCTDRTWNAK